MPFKSAVASAIAVHQVHTVPQRPRALNEDIHPEVEAVVLRSIEKQRELRPQKASLLARELIKAATVAFRSGFNAVPVAPVPEPDVEPEFGPAEEEKQCAETVEPVVEPGPTVEEGPAGKKKPKR